MLLMLDPRCLEEAAELLEIVLADHARNVDAWRCLTYVAKKRGDYSVAMAHITRALQLDANHIKSHCLRPEIEVNLTIGVASDIAQLHIARSIRFANSAVCVDRSSGYAWFILGCSLLTAFSHQWTRSSLNGMLFVFGKACTQLENTSLVICCERRGPCSYDNTHSCWGCGSLSQMEGDLCYITSNSEHGHVCLVDIYGGTYMSLTWGDMERITVTLGVDRCFAQSLFLCYFITLASIK